MLGKGGRRKQRRCWDCSTGLFKGTLSKPLASKTNCLFIHRRREVLSRVELSVAMNRYVKNTSPSNAVWLALAIGNRHWAIKCDWPAKKSHYCRGRRGENGRSSQCGTSPGWFAILAMFFTPGNKLSLELHVEDPIKPFRPWLYPVDAAYQTPGRPYAYGSRFIMILKRMNLWPLLSAPIWDFSENLSVVERLGSLTMLQKQQILRVKCL